MGKWADFKRPQVSSITVSFRRTPKVQVRGGFRLDLVSVGPLLSRPPPPDLLLIYRRALPRNRTYGLMLRSPRLLGRHDDQRESPDSRQRYVSRELTHLLGRAQPTDGDRYELVVTILQVGLLTPFR